MEEIVSIEWLSRHLNDKDLILLDASPASTIDGKQSDHQLKTIPGARSFDLNGNFSDKSSPFPNTLPTEKQFELETQKLGINKTSKIVVFDNLGIYTSPRVWWMYKTMGHDEVFVLNGGLPEWISKGFPIEDRKVENYPVGNFSAELQSQYLITYRDVLNNVHDKSFLIVDARSKGRFNGTEKEPRKHLKSGSIPNSANIPYNEVLENGKFKSESALKEIFNTQCGDAEDLVFSCGSGLTACIIMLASEISHQKSKRVYDGSWTEWAELQNLKEDIV